MNKETKARMILERLDETINVNWAFEKHYVKAIMAGLKDIEEEEQRGPEEQS